MTRTIEATFNDVDATIDYTARHRKMMIAKLAQVVENMDLTGLDNRKASDKESTLGIFSTFDSIMKSLEASEFNKAKIQLQHAKNQVDAGSQQAVVELLHMITANDVMRGSGGQDAATITSELESRVEEVGAISDGELME